jgi:hypothetical protein
MLDLKELSQLMAMILGNLLCGAFVGVFNPKIGFGSVFGGVLISLFVIYWRN